MKPLLLEITAFGPFAARVDLDFAALKDQPLVLIHGPTGGGKTSLLDAICFALFGSLSGDERQANDVRCTLADSDTLTRVVFDFALGNRRLRIAREPRQLRPAKRGDGTTEHAHAAWLWDRSDLGPADSGDGRLLAEKAGSVTTAVEGLLGFSVEQFRQVVVLPQGQFRRFLIEDSKGKEAILNALFGTALFEAITRRLQEVESSARTLVRTREEAITGILAGVGLGVDSDDADASVGEGRGEDGDNSLDRACAIAAQSLVEAHAAIAPARLAQQGASEALSTGRRKLAALDALARAKARLDTATADAAKAPSLRTRREAAQRAAPIEPLHRNTVARNNELGRAREALKVCQNHEEKATEALRTASIALAVLEAEPAVAARAAAERNQVQLSAMAGDVDALARAEQRLDDAVAFAGKAKLAREKVEGGLQRNETDLAATQSAIAALGETNVAVVAAQQACELRRRVAQQGRELDIDRGRVKDLTARRDAAGLRVGEAEAALVVVERADRVLRARWHAGQAAMLARDLQDDAPCPVCGSHDHPSPAHGDGELPTEQALEAAERAVVKARAGRDEARLLAATQAEQLVARQEAVDRLAGDLGDAANLLLAVLIENATASEAALKAAQADAKRAADLVETRKRHETSVAAASVAVRDATADEAKAAGLADVAKTARDGLIERVPQHLRDVVAYQSACAAATALRQKLDVDLTQARQKATASALEREQRRAAAAAASAAMDTAATLATQASTEEQDARAQATLVDDAALDAALADLGRFAAIERELTALERALAEAAALHVAATEAATALSASSADTVDTVDAAQLEAALAKNDTSLQAVLATDAAARARSQQLDDAQKRLGDAEARLREARERRDLTASVAQVAAGKNARGMSLQRYVLASLLDEVLRQASERLLHMSHGRYRLERTDVVSDRRSAAGLDLVVSDAYTGGTRPVTTLSGGESFLAALALSLGLSDVVMAYAGGIRLDALFIDEGFGTLDPESLDRALDVLVGLNEGGRLIGLISHVAELRARIDTRIEVRPGDRGSAVTVHAAP